MYAEVCNVGKSEQRSKAFLGAQLSVWWGYRTIRQFAAKQLPRLIVEQYLYDHIIILDDDRGECYGS
jgi:hypothetical protein